MTESCTLGVDGENTTNKIASSSSSQAEGAMVAGGTLEMGIGQCKGGMWC